MVSTAQFLPLVMQLGQYLKAGLDHYAAVRQAGESIDPDILAAYIAIQMDNWNPKLSGKSLLDAETKAAAARFLAGIAINFTGA